MYYIYNYILIICIIGLPGGSEVKNLPANAEESGLNHGLQGSPGEGNGNPLQYSCLGNLMDGGALWGGGHKMFRHNLVTTIYIIIYILLHLPHTYTHTHTITSALYVICNV